MKRTPSRLKIGSSTNRKSHIAKTATSKDGAKLGCSICGEGYESDDDDIHSSDVAPSSRPATRTSSAATLHLTYRLVICPKTHTSPKVFLILQNLPNTAELGKSEHAISIFLSSRPRCLSPRLPFIPISTVAYKISMMAVLTA
jgi:hypothetical protein